MKRIIILMLLLLCLLLTGCGTKMESAADLDVTNKSMFVVVEKGVTYKIVYHRETKVMYVISNGVYSAGNFTVMVDENEVQTVMFWLLLRQQRLTWNDTYHAIQEMNAVIEAEGEG